MNLYTISPNQEFLVSVANFILDKFKDIHLLKVILPNGNLCLELQKTLIKAKNAIILPNIIPFSDITSEKKLFKLIKPLEEKIFIADLIYCYPNLNFSFLQALKFAHLLSKSFHELYANNINYYNINEIIPDQNKMQHWQFIYKFLCYFDDKWKNLLKEKGKIDRTEYRINTLNTEIQRVKEDKNQALLLAGILGQDEISWQFIKNVSNLENGYVILPPMHNIGKDLLETKDFYCLNKLFNSLGKKVSDLTMLNYCDNQNKENLSQTIFPCNNEHFCENIFEEAELISDICKKNKDKKIAIILNNASVKEYYINFLSKYSLTFQDLLGEALSKTEIFNFILYISELLCREFDLKNLFVLLKSPLIISKSVCDLENLLLRKNRFISNWEQILHLLEAYHDKELLAWFSNIARAFNNKALGKQLGTLIREAIKIAEILCPNIWSKKYGFEIAEFFRELININYDINIGDLTEFPEFLKLISTNSRVYSKNNESNIIICKPKDGVLLKFDIVVIPDFNEESWPLKQTINPLISKDMEEALGLYSENIKSSTLLYMFYLLLHNSKVIITRSKKYGTKSDILPSNYLLRLKAAKLICSNEFILSNVVEKSDAHNDKYITRKEQYNRSFESKIKSQIFPKKISASDIELLIRNPYAFYAKKILNLKNLGSISSPAKISEFGSFVHRVIEGYTKIYSNDNEKLESFINVAQNILDKIDLFEQTKKLWFMKVSAIAEEFIDFDESRRKNTSIVAPEVSGEMDLEINGFNIKITAIADRIEITKKGTVAILDYKTGSLPTKKDVFFGLSPQLIIEALICQNAGFSSIGMLNISEIVYVKISNSRPYIKTDTIELTRKDLERHKSQMISLLDYYINNKVFYKEVDLLKYNDYKHLSRVFE